MKSNHKQTIQDKQGLQSDTSQIIRDRERFESSSKPSQGQIQFDSETDQSQPFHENLEGVNSDDLQLRSDLDQTSRILTKALIGFRPLDFVHDQIFLKADVFNLTGYYPLMKLSKMNQETSYLRPLSQVSFLDPASFDYHYECHNYAISGQVEQELFNQERKDPTTYLISLVKQFYFRLLLQREIESSRLLSKLESYDEGNRKTITKKWTDKEVKVVDEIQKAKDIILRNTSLSPNYLIISDDVYEKLQKKEELLEYVKYTGEGKVSVESLARILSLDKVIIGNSYYKKVRSTVTESVFKNMISLVYVPKDVSLPSFALGFQRKFHPQAYRYQTLEGGRILSYVVMDSYQQVVINPSLGYLFKNVV